MSLTVCTPFILSNVVYSSAKLIGWFIFLLAVLK